MASAVNAAVANGDDDAGDGGGASGGGIAGTGASGGRAHRLPRWTRHEILVLIQGKRAVEGMGGRRGRLPAVASSQAVVEPKWAAVSAYCRRRGVDRGAVQCRKRWSNLACDFKKIRVWESGKKGGEQKGESFWEMRNDRRRELRLPGFFDREVYDILDGAAGDEEVEEEEEEAVFDSGRTAAEDGLFSDYEQENEAEMEMEEEERTPVTPAAGPAVVVMPISERKFEPYQQDSSDPGMVNDKQAADIPEKGTLPKEGQKRRRTSQEGVGDASLQRQLIEVLERNSRMVTAQLEAQNINFQLDRDQRKEQADNLLSVLNKLADAIGKIADKF